MDTGTRRLTTIILQTVFSMAGLAPKVPKIKYQESTAEGHEDLGVVV